VTRAAGHQPDDDSQKQSRSETEDDDIPEDGFGGGGIRAASQSRRHQHFGSSARMIMRSSTWSSVLGRTRIKPEPTRRRWMVTYQRGPKCKVAARSHRM